MTSQSAKQKHLRTRPCDACAIRRVRCDVQQNPDGICTSCKNHDVKCTNIRVRHKSGPKKIKQKTRDSIVNLITSSTENSNKPSNGEGPDTIKSTFTLNQLLPFLQIYQTWFYCIWPILSVTQLTSKMNAKSQGNDEALIISDVNMAEQYALSCAVCAVISRHRQFLKSAGDTLNWGNYPTPHEYASEAKRIIYDFDLRGSATMEALLANYFLHCYYCNIPNGAQMGLMYLREAISIAHVLNLHNPDMYATKSPAEGHRFRKIYYQLLVTERFVAFECGIPVLLEPTIPIPSQEDEEYPDLLLGFTELAQVFAVTDKQFFQELHTKVLSGNRNEFGNMFQYNKISMLQDFIQTQPLNVKRQWIYQLQKKLARKIQHENMLMDSQKVNILVSKVWFQSIGWLISSENMLINADSDGLSDDYFSASFPLKITKEFLNATEGLPDFAFESNGPGVSMKLLEVADSLHSFTMMTNNDYEASLAFDQMNTIFKLIIRFKNDMELPHNLFNKIKNALSSRSLTITELSSSSESGGSIELLDDNEFDDNEAQDVLTGFTQPVEQIVETPAIEDPDLQTTELLRDLSSSNLKSLLNMDFGTPGNSNFSLSPFFQQTGPTNSNMNSPIYFQPNGLTPHET